MTFKLPVAVTTNPDFIAFNAHFWVAYAVVVTFSRVWWVAPIVTIVAAVKEFYIDARYEVPPQTAHDNWLDFLGYVLGAVVGVTAVAWLV